MTYDQPGIRMTKAGSIRYRFGDCELDAGTRQLWRGGEPEPLQPRVFDLLIYLIEQRDRAVDKDEIQDAVWAPSIVSETAMTRAIMKARRAVGDDAELQSVIRTVHGHGYQFVAELVAESNEPIAAAADPKVADTGAHDQEPEDERVPQGLGVRRAGLALATLIVAAVIGVSLWPRGPSTEDGIRVAVLPIANDTGNVEYDWARLGLMGLANELFDNLAVVDTVTTADVISFVENTGWDGAIDGPDALERATRLRDAYGASHVLFAALEEHVGGLRLSYTLVDSDGLRAETTMVSPKGTALVRGMVAGVSNLLSGRRYAPAGTAEAVDDDPFINEAYARALATALEGRCAEAAPLFDVVLARNPDLVQARIQGANCRFELGETPTAERSLLALLERDDVKADGRLEAQVLRLLGKVRHRSGRLDLADTAYRDAMAVAEAIGDREATGRALITTAILAKDRRQFDEARALLARATLQFRQLEWQVLPGQIASTLANIAMNDGELDAAEQHLEDAIEGFRAIGDRANEAKMLNNYGFLRRLQGRFSEAEPLHLQSLELRRAIGDRVGQGRNYNFLSVLYQRERRFEEAREAADEAVGIAREADDQLFLATGLSQRGAAERALGLFDESIATYSEAREIFLNIEDVSRALQVSLRLARIDMERGDNASAEERVADVLTQALSAELPEPAIEAMRYAGDLARRRGDDATARDYFEQGLAHVDETGFESLRVSLAQRLVALYLDVDSLAQAEPLLGFLVEQEPNSFTLVQQARYAHKQADHEQAVALMKEAKSLSGDRWNAQDEAQLERYRQAAGSTTQP
ncbi:MAG: tetratricopeptide repeat protein [Pseudomonadota bacterium]